MPRVIFARDASHLPCARCRSAGRLCDPHFLNAVRVLAGYGPLEHAKHDWREGSVARRSLRCAARWCRATCADGQRYCSDRCRRREAAARVREHLAEARA